MCFDDAAVTMKSPCHRQTSHDMGRCMTKARRDGKDGRRVKDRETDGRGVRALSTLIQLQKAYRKGSIEYVSRWAISARSKVIKECDGM